MNIKKISISLPEDLLKSLDDLAKEKKISRSKIIAEALEDYLGKHKTGKPEKYQWKTRKTKTLKTQTPRRVKRGIRKR